MTIDYLIKHSGLERIDAEVLIAEALKKSRTWVHTHAKENIADVDQKTIEPMLARRKRGEPVAYIVGHKEFYERSFAVNPSVLIPRPSTEGLIDLALAFLEKAKDEVREVDSGIVAIAKKIGNLDDVTAIADIGTGSGCIAITIALERPDLIAIAIDTSSDALKVAEKNAEALGANDQCIFLHSNALERMSDFSEPFIIVSNPPYIPIGEELPRDVKEFEPASALFAGLDGMDVLRPLWRDAHRLPHCRGIVLECSTDQADTLLKIAKD